MGSIYEGGAALGEGQGAAATSGTRAAAVSRSGTARAVGWAARLGFGPVGARAFFLFK